jgi:hypothetical protein
MKFNNDLLSVKDSRPPSRRMSAVVMVGMAGWSGHPIAKKTFMTEQALLTKSGGGESIVGTETILPRN